MEAGESGNLTLTIVQDGQNYRVQLTGTVGNDFRLHLQQAVELNARTIKFDCASLSGFQGNGTSEWVQVFRDLAVSTTIEFHRCSIALMQAAGQKNAMIVRDQLFSFYAPFHCDSCGQDQEKLLKISGPIDFARLNSMRSACICSGEAKPTQDLAEYLSFCQVSDL